jgi:GDPmannose 4,6-dehydratase
MRPAKVDILLGNTHKAKANLGWNPSVSFLQLIKMMVDVNLQKN